MSNGGKQRLPWMKKRNKSLQMLIAHQAKAQRSAQSSLESLSTNGDDTGPDCQNRSNLDKYCPCLKEMMARDFPDWTTTVKLHMLTNHVPEFARRYRSWDSFSEQGIETSPLLASIKDSQPFLPIRPKMKKLVENENINITHSMPKLSASQSKSMHKTLKKDGEIKKLASELKATSEELANLKA
uniref:Uncharacterized protein n=1 Tax=Romanomermis culicivorax TaxID=13658 RepID=A0A915L5I2_ROMCU